MKIEIIREPRPSVWGDRDPQIDFDEICYCRPDRGDIINIIGREGHQELKYSTTDGTIIVAKNVTMLIRFNPDEEGVYYKEYKPKKGKTK